MSNHFTHLHLHSEYSLLDGAISLDRLINFGKEHNFKALAITDHGNIFGAVKFFQQCKKAGIKPIIGMEAYFTEDVTIKAVDKKYYHLIILVQNAVGYKNLCKLISLAYQEGFYFKPRIDYLMLEKHYEGLIVTSACLGGHIPSLLMSGQDQEAEARMDWFLSTFGRERFFLEVQPEDQREQAILNQKIFEWSAKKNINVIATGDCHYVLAEDREAHEVMLSIQTQHKITDPDRFTFGDCRVHMRTTDEMLTLFKEHPESVWNTGKIADMCDFTFDTGKLFFPKFEIPHDHTPETFFTKLSREGFEKLINNDRINKAKEAIYRERLELEIDLIVKMGFVGYFLVVSDFIQWARRNGRQQIPYLFPELAPVLQETYGVIVYQEQVMKIAAVIADYSLGEADILRRAMGKKKPEEMAKQRSLFMERATKKSFDEKKAGELFDLMAYFAGYGFNKSHSAAYALIAYQTAYLKAHYPAEFMACLISLEATNADNMSFYLQEARDMGIPILAPDINRSTVEFTVVDGKILFGLQGIKNVGLAALENIIAERTKEPFIDMLDFCYRVDLRTANKRVVENLICAGAFDVLPGNRAQKHEELESIIERALDKKKAALTGQMGLFSFADPQQEKIQGKVVHSFTPREDWDNKTKLEKEREVIGFYLSAHPLDTYNNFRTWLNIA